MFQPMRGGLAQLHQQVQHLPQQVQQVRPDHAGGIHPQMMRPQHGSGLGLAQLMQRFGITSFPGFGR